MIIFWKLILKDIASQILKLFHSFFSQYTFPKSTEVLKVIAIKNAAELLEIDFS